MTTAFDVIAVGGGPAGMMAAITAAGLGAKTALLEPNSRLGKKLNITGKGRCNLTNDCTREAFFASIPGNAPFLYSAYSRMTAQDAMAFFEGLGVPLKTERGGRVFPQSDRSFDVSAALERRLGQLGVTWLHDRAMAVLTEDGAVTGVRGERGRYETGRAIVATGGVSYPGTGSTGDGYRLARMLGHTIEPPQPSLVPLTSPDPACAAMQGLSLRNVAVRFLGEGDALLYQDFGELLFTHFGLSGPVVLSASAYIRPMRPCTLSIDLKPALDEKKLDERILRDIAAGRNRDMDHILAGLVHRSMVPVVLERTGIGASDKANGLTKAQRRALVALLKDFRIPIDGTRPIDEAIITAGGVRLSEVWPKTMESKLVKGLYFAGEVLDLDACTGGFNLQIAWCTGAAAGEAAALWIG